MVKFDVHYMKEQGGRFEKTQFATEDQFLEWVKTEGVKVFFFDVFRFEPKGAE